MDFDQVQQSLSDIRLILNSCQSEWSSHVGQSKILSQIVSDLACYIRLCQTDRCESLQTLLHNYYPTITTFPILVQAQPSSEPEIRGIFHQKQICMQRLVDQLPDLFSAHQSI